MIDIDTYIQNQNRKIEEKLSSLVPEKNVLHRTLYQAARYSLLGGGKRLRPILAIATAETLGCHQPVPLSVPCALEMIHTYSLIHDDLPCMDNDEFRRGKPSLHRAFHEGHAVLAGDFLLTRAFEVIAMEPLLTSHQKTSMIACLAKYAGGDGMIGGQVADIEQLSNSPNDQILREVHSLKTAALITASILLGSMIARAQKKEIEILRNFGYAIGLAFQVVDDILDATSTQEKLGKKPGSDLQNRKQTFASLLGIEKACEQAQRFLEEGLSHLKKLERNTNLLENLAKKFIQR